MRFRGMSWRSSAVAIGLVATLGLAACSSSGSDEATTGGVATTAGAKAGTATTASGASSDAGSATTPSPGTANPYGSYRSDVYASDTNWLCRPGKTGTPCDDDLDVTVVGADGTTKVEPFAKAADPPIDCFYVYPTISADPPPNADLDPGNEEKGVVKLQAARFGSQCRVFAPVYRQVPVAGLTAFASGSTTTTAPGTRAPFEVAYADVLDAWKQYMANDNHGRGVVLIGHSQGTGHLTKLIHDEIDPNPALRAQLVSALMIGGAVTVPSGADVGGDFADVPLCRSADQVGCVIAYNTFRSTSPPPANSLFGRPRGSGDGTVACTNPAALGGGSGDLAPIYPASTSPWNDPSSQPAITTPWVELPGLVRAECVQRDGFSYLEITVQPDQSGPRVDDVTGDLTPQWGLHLVDVNLAMPQLVDIVRQESAAYQAAH